MTVWQLLDAFGVFVFALSGALAAARRGMDLFGFLVIALLPAVGGGTVRDLVLDVPVFWVADGYTVYLVAAAAVLTYLVGSQLHRRERLLAWCDAVGLATFCVLGAQKTLAITGQPVIAVMMGVASSVLGGMIRDVVCNEIPLVLHREIYATAAFLGAVVYVAAVGLGLPSPAALALGAVCAFTLRALAMVYGLSLPHSRPSASIDDPGASG